MLHTHARTVTSRFCFWSTDSIMSFGSVARCGCFRAPDERLLSSATKDSPQNALSRIGSQSTCAMPHLGMFSMERVLVLPGILEHVSVQLGVVARPLFIGHGHGVVVRAGQIF